MRSFPAVCAVAVCVMLTGCSARNDNALNGDGAWKQNEYALSDGVYSVNVSADSVIGDLVSVSIDEEFADKLVIESHENITDFFKVDIDEENKSINIKCDADIRFDRTFLTVCVGVPVNRVTLSGNAESYWLNYENCTAKSLDISIDGSCQGTVSGNFDALKAAVNGKGKLTLSGSADELLISGKSSDKIDTSNLNIITIAKEGFLL